MDANLLLKSYLKKLRLPVMARELDNAMREAAKTGLPHDRFLLGLVEQEVLQREENGARLRIQRARFPLIKTLDGFDFSALPSLDKQRVLQLAQGEFLREAAAVVCVGNAGTGKTHIAVALGVALCRRGFRVRFFTAAGLVNELLEARKEGRLGRLLKGLSRFDLVILDELGYIPFDEAGAQLLFNFCAERYERASLLATTNLEFGQWVKVFGDEALTGALLDRLTHRCHILLMNGESYRFRQSQGGAGAKGRKPVPPKRRGKEEKREGKEVKDDGLHQAQADQGA